MNLVEPSLCAASSVHLETVALHSKALPSSRAEIADLGPWVLSRQANGAGRRPSSCPMFLTNAYAPLGTLGLRTAFLRSLVRVPPACSYSVVSGP